MQVLVRISWNMQSGKEGKDKERAIKLHITDSNYDRKTFILQQSLKRRKNSAWNVDLTKILMNSLGFECHRKGNSDNFLSI